MRTVNTKKKISVLTPKADQVEKKITPHASEFLTAGINHMKARETQYDAPEGERSMRKTVQAFNVITGHNLNEEQGWLWMGLLKMVRSQQGGYKQDHYEDLAAYAALQGECAAKTRQ